jgi:hypothetical protein
MTTQAPIVSSQDNAKLADDRRASGHLTQALSSYQRVDVAPHVPWAQHFSSPSPPLTGTVHAGTLRPAYPGSDGRDGGWRSALFIILAVP